jgi:uncharacterized protein YndB with AHSA1/START domain
MSVVVQDLLVRKTIRVEAPPEHVFGVFSERIDAWWPRAHHIGKAERFTAILQPGVGGRWYERGDDGSECDWGRVLAWEPPRRIVLAWQINAQWQYDPSFETEVEVHFVAEAPERTRVELEHRRLERFGSDAEMMRRIFDAPDAWAGTLEAMAREAQRLER